MSNTRTKQQERTLYIILAAALAARLLLALVTEGYTYDMSCFVAWGDKLAAALASGQEKDLSDMGLRYDLTPIILRTTRPATSLCWGWSAWCARRFN